MEVRPVQPARMNIYQSNTYIKDLSWLHLDIMARVRENQDQQFYITVSVAYLTNPRSK